MIFLAMAHKDPELATRFLNTLYPNKVVLHIDRNSDRAEFVRHLVNSDHVYVLPTSDSHFVRWGGFSVVRAMKSLLRQGVKIAKPNERLLFVSCQDYLIKPLSELEKHLDSKTNIELISYFLISKKQEKHYSQISKLDFDDIVFWKKDGNPSHVRLINGAIRRLINIILYPLTLHRIRIPKAVAFGSNWIVLTKECADFILTMKSKKLETY